MRSWIATGLCVWIWVGFSVPILAVEDGVDLIGGAVTWDWPAVGSFDTDKGTCTATLIGCRTVLTAAHCVCDPTGTGALCPDGNPLLDPSEYLVFFQNAGDQDPFSGSLGQYPVSNVQVAPGYTFGVSSDVVVLELLFPVRGIRPEPFNTSASPAVSTAATIVGFGTTSEGGPDSGIKREGVVTTEDCVTGGGPAANHVCWSSAPVTICSGDSGGPLFADPGGGLTLAGVHSGGDPLCGVGDVAFDADVFVDHSWIETAGGADLTVAACGDGFQVGDVEVTTDEILGILATIDTGTFTVAAGTKLLRVALNAEVGSPLNDFDLRLRFGSPPTLGTHDCFPGLAGSFEFCEIADPSPGTWHWRVDVFAGGPGEYQLTATHIPENPAPPALAADDLLVADFLSWEMMQVDGATGDRRILSSQLRGAGPMLTSPEDVELDPNGDAVATNASDRSVLEIDLTTGDRTVLSGCPDFACGSPVGSGPDFLGPRFAAFEASGDLVISDRESPGVAAVVRIDPANGNRSIVSGCNNAACAGETGDGPSFLVPFGIAVVAGGDIVVVDSFGLVSVDPSNGNRALLAGGGSGEAFRQPRDLAVEADGDFVVVDGDAVAPAVFHVDAGTGSRTVISGCADSACAGSIGTGPAFGAGLLGVEIVAGGDLVVTDGEQGSLFRVDRSNGNRTLLSGCIDASCSSVNGSGTHFTSPAGVALPEPGTGLGLWAGSVLLAVLRRRREA